MKTNQGIAKPTSHPSQLSQTDRQLAEVLGLDIERLSRLKKYLSILFDPDDHVCFAQSTYGTSVFHVHDFISAYARGDQFIGINALDGHNDREPLTAKHSVDRPRRASANVTKFRSFLIEFDNIALGKQLETLHGCGLAPSAIVFSGSKSLHALYSLEHSLDTAFEYTATAKALHSVFKGLADSSTKDPVRLSRLPEVIRNETGRIQKVISAHTRIPNDILTSREFCYHLLC